MRSITRFFIYKQPFFYKACIAVLLSTLSVFVVSPRSVQAAQTTPEQTNLGEVESEQTYTSDYSPGLQGSITRIYLAVFGRQPDTEGLNYWSKKYATETDLLDIADFFIVSPEWRIRYLSPDSKQMPDGDFVRLLYKNILGRTPDTDGEQYWLQKLGEGTSRSSILLGFSESSEFITKTNTAQAEYPTREKDANSPTFPAQPDGSGTGRRIIYSNAQQRVWLMSDTDVIHDSYLVSGKEGVPNPGIYNVFSKSEKAWAGHDGITMNHMVRFARGSRLAIGFHSIPLFSDGSPLQTVGALGTYRSAGCVRQEPQKAEALYDWAEVGTRVIVIR